MKPLVVIPARGNSKRLPGKNIKPLNGKPLIHYTIEAARTVFKDSEICVSTDDEKIKAVAEQTGLNVPFLRPEELASDTSGTREVLLHAIDYYKEMQGYEADTVILLQPTSPFRTAKHIEEALAAYHEGIDMVVSVKKTAANPYFVLFEENDEGFLKKSKEGNFARSQDCPDVWEFNGAVYIINSFALRNSNIAEFTKVLKYEMDELSSLDIDTGMDWKMVEFINGNKSIKRKNG